MCEDPLTILLPLHNKRSCPLPFIGEPDKFCTTHLPVTPDTYSPMMHTLLVIPLDAPSYPWLLFLDGFLGGACFPQFQPWHLHGAYTIAHAPLLAT